MKILAIDIGAGTQDILLFDSRKKIENSTSLVLPTPSKIFAERLKRIESDVYLHGDTIGGGALARAIISHLQKGYHVGMDESAAYSIRNDLEEVLSMGISVGKKPPSNLFQEMEIREIDLPLLGNFLSHFGEDLTFDVIAVAVQDHGVSPKGVSDRVFRFEQMEALLRKDNRPETLHYEGKTVPPFYPRMRSIVNAVSKCSSTPVLVMDTSFSAILGCLDEVADPSLIVNVGNGHTVAALLIEGRIEGLYEHHTHELTPERLEYDLKLFPKGELNRKEVFEAKGHGVITLKPYQGEVSVIVTGPNRDLLRNTGLRVFYAAPGGNTMMTGPLGLVKAAQFWINTKSQTSNAK